VSVFTLALSVTSKAWNLISVVPPSAFSALACLSCASSSRSRIAASPRPLSRAVRSGHGDMSVKVILSNLQDFLMEEKEKLGKIYAVHHVVQNNIEISAELTYEQLATCFARDD
jgi:hypothetical protein